MFSGLGDKQEVDPCAQIFLRRVFMFRRMVVKNPKLLDLAYGILHKYCNEGYVGTLHSNCDLLLLEPAPPVGSPHRGAWKPRVPPLGPIGLMLYSAHQYGVAIDRNFKCNKRYEVSIPFLETPIQYLRPLLRQFINQARSTLATRASQHQK